MKLPDNGLSHAERTALVDSFIKRARGVASRMRDSGVPYEDLVSAAYFGLVKASTLFRPEFGNQFSTYAYWWVNRFVQMEISQWHHHGFRQIGLHRMPKRADVCDQLPAKQDEDSEGYERLISILPEWMAMIVRLRIEHNMTMPRVANVIGVSKWNAWDLERRALKQLRTHLENP